MPETTVYVTITPSYCSFRVDPAYFQSSIDTMLWSFFKYQDPDAYYNGRLQPGKTHRLYDRLNKSLPFGLAKEAIDLLKLKGFGVKINNTIRKQQIKKSEIHGRYKPKFGPREYQEQAIEAALKKRFGIVEVPCGGGKTLIAENIIAEANQEYTLVVTDGRNLLDQTWRLLKQAFPNHTVLKWGDGRRVHKYEKNSNIIIVSTYHSIPKLMTPELAKRIGLVIADECHRIAAEMFSMVAKIIPYPFYRIGLSATPDRDNEDTILVKGYLGEVIYSIDQQTLIDQGFSCPPVVKTIKLSQMDEGEMSTFLKQHKKVLFITERIESVNNFQAQFPFIDALTGQTSRKKFCERLEAYKEAETDALVCTRVLDQGFDHPPIDAVVQFDVYKSKVKIEQAIGRGTRPHSSKDACFAYFDVSSGKAINTFRYFIKEVLDKKPHYTFD